MSKKGEVGYLYLNGLGDGKVTVKDRLVHRWWQWSGRTIEHAGIDWYNGGTLTEKEKQVEAKVVEMIEIFGGVAIIGGSAGGSLALNVFAAMKEKAVVAVTAHARVKVGNYAISSWMSLQRRAKLGTRQASQAFFDSVTKVESATIPSFTDEDKSRILNLTQLTDSVVDLDLMEIAGVQKHRSLAFGHSGGFLAHMFADRDLIIEFAEGKLTVDNT